MTGLVLIASLWGAVFGVVVRAVSAHDRRLEARWAVHRRLNYWGLSNERAMWAHMRDGGDY